MPKKPATTEPKKRKVSFKGAKAKGSKFEREFVDAMTKLGIPSHRVISSGATRNAKADVKVGVVLNEDGTMPAHDETQPILRAECKNLAVTPEYLFEQAVAGEDLTIVMSSRQAPDALWKHLRQAKENKIVALRRAKVPDGALKNEEFSEYIGVFMDAEVFADLLRRAYPDRVYFAPEAQD